MKRYLIAALALIAFFSTSQAQMPSNAVFFSENGEGFYIVMNGLRMNDAPVTNLKVTDLIQPSYKIKVIFDNADLGEFNKNIYFNDPGMEIVYNIKRNRKGEWKLGYQSATPLAQAPPAPVAQQVIHWGDPHPTAPPVPVSGGTTVIVEETTTTTTHGGTMGGSSDQVNMNVNVDGFGLNVNVNASDGGMGMGTSSSSTMTTTTTTTTTSSGMIVNEPVAVVVEEPAPCPAMGPGDFSDACSSIRSKSFSDSKMTLAKQIVRAHCVTANQVHDMTKLFDFESDRLEFAKFAFDYTVDQNQYYKVNDAFDFESSIEELDEYIGRR